MLVIVTLKPPPNIYQFSCFAIIPYARAERRQLRT